ncbi:MAG: hypothetical protein KIS79_15590 [Burkholderiales bacterium]|nr:hypothetical protein [Burkholderiales bacterium]
MNQRFGSVIFFLFLAAAAVFVWTTSASLPPVVASHFAASGIADGFMSRPAYRLVLLLLVVGIPLLVAFGPLPLIGKRGMSLNIPHRQYWLAPERREQTLGVLRRHGLWFGASVALFVAYVHWLVVLANRLQPPQLSMSALLWGMGVFFAALAAWLFVLYSRFRNRT